MLNCIYTGIKRQSLKFVGKCLNEKSSFWLWIGVCVSSGMCEHQASPNGSIPFTFKPSILLGLNVSYSHVYNTLQLALCQISYQIGFSNMFDSEHSITSITLDSGSRVGSPCSIVHPVIYNKSTVFLIYTSWSDYHSSVIISRQTMHLIVGNGASSKLSGASRYGSLPMYLFQFNFTLLSAVLYD